MKTDDKERTDEVKPADRRRRILLGASEIAMVVGCAIIFVAFLAALINVFFPIGSELVGDYEEEQLDDIRRVGDVVIDVDSQQAAGTQGFAGEIVRIGRRVQRRNADSLAWVMAYVGDEVASNDAVQTFARSAAIVQLNRRSHLTIGENSLIVFDEQATDPFLQTAQSVLVMMDGELSGTFATDDVPRFQFGVRLPNSDVTLKPEEPGDNVEFMITVNDDKSTTVNLHSGTAEIVTGEGDERTIGSQDSITIDASGAAMQVSKIPSAPVTVGPTDNSVVKFREVPKQVIFKWEPVDRADRYHIIVARDPEFSDRLVDDDVVGNSFTHGALAKGTYYWQVRSRARLSQSAQSESHQLRVIQDLEAPLLELESPTEAVSSSRWRLQGRTDVDASVYVDGVEVANVNGSIDEAIDLLPGANIITVRAVDEVGNHSYASVAINAK